MTDQITCPACEGRGSYCLWESDPVWSELAVRQVPCELCNGLGKIAQVDVDEYDLDDRAPFFPYRPYDD